MKVILMQDVENVGKKFDVRDVADGYARNFLLPRGLAKPATDSAMKALENEKVLAAKKAEEELKETEQAAVKIDGQEFEMASKADDTGKLYGSITGAKIAKFLKDNGFDVKKDNIKLEEPIKELGEYDITLELDHGLEASIKLIIVPEEDKA